MVKAKIPLTPPVPTGTASPKETSLLLVRMKELDREFARQTKQLTALTKKFAKKLNEPITLGKPPKTKP